MNEVVRLLTLKLDHTSFVLYDIPYRSSDELHDHPDWYQIVIPLMGTPLVQHNNKIKSLLPSEHIVISPEQPHRKMSSYNPVRLFIINIERKYLTNVFTQTLGDVTPFSVEFSPWGTNSLTGLRRLGESLMQELMHNPTYLINKEEVEWQLASNLLSFQDGSHSPYWSKRFEVYHQPILNRVTEFIQDHFSENLDLETLASVAGISKFYMIRQFKQELGITPSQFVTKIRVQKAMDLLKHSPLSVTQISYEVGFGSLSSFEKSFKQYYKVSPSKFRKQM